MEKNTQKNQYLYYCRLAWLINKLTYLNEFYLLKPEIAWEWYIEPEKLYNFLKLRLSYNFTSIKTLSDQREKILKNRFFQWRKKVDTSKNCYPPFSPCAKHNLQQ